jgi:hypothetical protein
MKIDELVKKRFMELDGQATNIRPINNDIGTYVDPEKCQMWASSVLNLLHRVFGESSSHFQSFQRQYEKLQVYSYQDFAVLKGIFGSAQQDYGMGYLFTVRGLIKAEDSTDVLEQATNLLNGNYKDAACILVGVALEIAIKEMCNRTGISITKLDVMNIELAKKTIYNAGVQKQVTAWAHWRNKAAHGEFGEYNNADVKSMIEGVQRFVADYL